MPSVSSFKARHKLALLYKRGAIQSKRLQRRRGAIARYRFCQQLAQTYAKGHAVSVEANPKSDIRHVLYSISNWQRIWCEGHQSGPALRNV